jgi:tRNA(Leu) C34 or U34 (ribose-2'-O)-methylase TrmL
MTFGIVLDHPKNADNVAHCLRTAHAFGASLVAVVGSRVRAGINDPINTVRAERHIPVLDFPTWGDLQTQLATDWMPIGVELAPGAVTLPGFVHPKSCLYLFGPEDGSLNCAPLKPRHVVKIPSIYCLNLALAVGITLYDRASKSGDYRAKPRSPNTVEQVSALRRQTA